MRHTTSYLSPPRLGTGSRRSQLLLSASFHVLSCTLTNPLDSCAISLPSVAAFCPCLLACHCYPSRPPHVTLFDFSRTANRTHMPCVVLVLSTNSKATLLALNLQAAKIHKF